MAAPQPLQIVQSLLRLRQPGQHCLGLRQQQPAGRGQRNTATDPVEQRRAQAGLQCRDGRARRRLRHVQRRSRLRHVQALGDSDEDAQLVKGHRRINIPAR